MERKSVVINFPPTMIERVEKYQDEKGFATRTQAILALINEALNQSEKSR